jgi:ribonuclease HII
MNSDAEPADLWRHEKKGRRAGHACIAGVDEVGRGPLAGPVVAACVVLPNSFSTDGIDDSKRLTAAQRDRAYLRIMAEAIAVAVGEVPPAVIDRINILRASQEAMRLAVTALNVRPTLLLVDGRPVPDLSPAEQWALVGGDHLSVSIAAASIVAKVTRDRYMILVHEQYPEYGFNSHKGYSAAQHLKALRLFGPCPLHRRSFAPVAQACAERDGLTLF